MVHVLNEHGHGRRTSTMTMWPTHAPMAWCRATGSWRYSMDQDADAPARSDQHECMIRNPREREPHNFLPPLQ